MCKGLKKQLAVGVIEKDLLAGIPPTGHMINRTGKLQDLTPTWADQPAQVFTEVRMYLTEIGERSLGPIMTLDDRERRRLGRLIQCAAERPTVSTPWRVANAEKCFG
jgi:hypothetical protein